MLPRVSYLPLSLSKILHFFQNIVDEIEDVEIKNIWMTSNGKMIKWHYPIGVLYDLHVTDKTLPWVITLRFKVC